MSEYHRVARAIYPDLADKVALVTGASRNIGRGIAEYLGAQRMRVLVCDRLADEGETCVRDLCSAGVDAVFIQADLASPEGARQAAEQAIARSGRIDVLVNNAAILRARTFLDTDEEMYRVTFEQNMRIVYGITHAIARHMSGNRSGTIINISSVGGVNAHQGMAGYDACKGAVDALTRAMAVELAAHGVRVNAVAPGAISRPGNPEPKPGRGAYIPLGRPADQEEVAAVVAFLASQSASYITGQILYVDGGVTVQLAPPGVFI